MEIKRGLDFSEDYIRWFSDISRKDISLVGQKASFLSELYNSKYPIINGFVVTTKTFLYIFEKNELLNKIKSILENVDYENLEELKKRSDEICQLIESCKFPKELENEILESYHILGSEKIEKAGVSQDVINILKTSHEPIFVSLKCSPSIEGLEDVSDAGHEENFFNIKGDKNLIDCIKRCYSSFFSTKSIYYRHKKGIKENKFCLAVIIQKMLDSQKSGIVFSKSPLETNDDIVIEAIYGLTEGIISGKISPDLYVVSHDLKIKYAEVANKKIAIVRNSSGNSEIVKLSHEKSKSHVLNNHQVLEIANYAIKIEDLFKKPQNIEFAIDDNKFYILQTKPMSKASEKISKKVIAGNVILEGKGVSPGISSGIVKIVKTLKDLKNIKQGEIIVCENTNLDFIVLANKAVAIVCEEGGLTNHASDSLREIGIPLVVGVENAMSLLKEGMRISVDGTNGKIYEGEAEEKKLIFLKPIFPTNRVKIKLIIDIPDLSKEAKITNVNDVGLLKIEGIIASHGKHPLVYQKENQLNIYSELLAKDIEKVAENFKSIWIRTSDIRSDEHLQLKGAPIKEENPLFGVHGIRFSLKYNKIFEAELAAIKNVAINHPNKKFGVLLPHIVSISEIKKAKEYFKKYDNSNIDLGVVVETPSAVQIIEDICNEGIKFILIETNDLTMHTLGIHPEDVNTSHLYDELHTSIFTQIKRVIGTCRRYKIETSICGNAVVKKEMIDFLVKKGINSITVNPADAYEVSKVIDGLETLWRESNVKNLEEYNKSHKNDLPELSDQETFKPANISDFPEQTSEKDIGEIRVVNDLDAIEMKEKEVFEEINKEKQEVLIDHKRIENQIEVDEEEFPNAEDILEEAEDFKDEKDNEEN